ncbi:MAG TPA: lytic murein transglycosylase [Vicinamibacterales bacterium]
MPLVAALLAVLLGASAASAQPPVADRTLDLESFGSWLEDVRQEALSRGLRPATVDRAFAGIAPVPRVLERDRAQAEFTLSLDDYLKRRLDSYTVRTARRMMARHRTVLRRVSNHYGVDARILVAIWGLESGFGRITGARPTIPVLATLAWDGRRGEFFRSQLFDALTILDRGDIEIGRLKGSWAGAMGQVQFMPSSYLTWAEDFDGDGRRDIWSSMPDVFASIANYLKGHGWVDRPWGFAVRVPGAARDDIGAMPARTSGCRAMRTLTQQATLAEWRRMGVVLAGGTPLPASSRPASLLQIDDRAWLVTPSYEAILAYNCAHSYALSVGMLADRLPK